ncbi:hypothetical protein [Mucilaginibacter antarcticus]|uniref:Uncharacterized protein n=1 Tax=Mucilaginibacter antarcticus TaxID=1855725 RepID=A0ABW5XSV8_9SPHI
MNRLILLSLLIPCLAFGQHTKGVKRGKYYIGVDLKGKEAVLANKYCTCFNNHKYNPTQRRSFFPFNKAASVRLISFTLPSDINQPDDYSLAYTPVSAGHYKINTRQIKESKILSGAAVDSLTDMMYNVGYTPIKLNFKLVSARYNCYDPHNAILFFNNEGEVNEYIELCFDCERYFLSSSKIKNTIYCDQKYDMLKGFFVAQGIKYGTVLP